MQANEQHLTKTKAIITLNELKSNVELYKKNIKGRAGLIRDIKRAVEFITRHMIDDRTNSLIVREKKRDFDKFRKSAYVKENQGR